MADGDVAGNDALVFERRDGDLPDQLGPVFGVVDGLANEGVRCGEQPFHAVQLAAIAARALEDARGFAHQLFARVTGEMGEGGVGVDDVRAGSIELRVCDTTKIVQSRIYIALKQYDEALKTLAELETNPDPNIDMLRAAAYACKGDNANSIKYIMKLSLPERSATQEETTEYFKKLRDRCQQNLTR